MSYSSELNGLFTCELCESSFDTQKQRSDHILDHFKRQQCESCGKITFKICDIIFELHDGADDCCRPTVSSPHSSDGADMVTSSNRIGSMPAQVIDLMGGEFEIVVAPVKSENAERHSKTDVVARRKSGRVRKRKIRYNSGDDDVPISNDSTEKVTTDVNSVPNDNSSESMVKEEHLDGSTTDDGWSVDGRPALRTDRPEGAISADEIVDGGTADEDEYLPVQMQKCRKVKPKTTRPLNIPCNMCHTLFRTQRTLQIHQRAEHGINPSTECDICKKVFTSVGNLKQHKQTHNDTRRYICSYCGKGFNLHFNLKDHMNEHTGEKPYVCGVCGKAFGKASHRVAHMRVSGYHTSHPQSTTIRFDSFSAELIRFIVISLQVHTGEKPYKCTFENCDRAYAHSTDLKRHRRAQHGIITKTFACPICGKIFFENKFLTKHLKVHKEKN